MRFFFINKAKALVLNVSYIFQDFSFFLRGAKIHDKNPRKTKIIITTYSMVKKHVSCKGLLLKRG